MLDILTIVHSFADAQTASRIRRTCHRLANLIPQPTLYSEPSFGAMYEYKVGNKLHRLDGPARQYMRIHAYWYREGIAHREYHPQYAGKRYKEYRANGVYHREAGPSIVYNDAVVDWYMRGTQHRKVGPACTCDGAWYTLDNLHRLDGPAYLNRYIIRGVEHSIYCSMGSLWIVDDIIIRK